MQALNLNRYRKILDRLPLTKEVGKITHVTGFLMQGFLPGASIGSVCRVFPATGQSQFLAEVVGFREKNVLLMPLGDMKGVGLGSKLVLERPMATIKVGPELLGRVLDGLGMVLDGRGDPDAIEEVPIYQAVQNPLHRIPINKPIDMGIRAINGLITLGKGQRVAVMAGSGVGKSVLMGMVGRSTDADVNVIAMVGERGREVREFIEDILGEDGLKKSVVVVASSDQSPLLRMRAAFVATAVAEYFCKNGKDVLLMMDSITRFAMAQREIGLSTGEPPASKGYTPSVFSLMPKLVERAGVFENQGSLTGLYTVLVEGDDMDDPIADSVRSIVDGHIVLSRQLAEIGHFPAIDLLASTSRVMRRVVSPTQVQMATKFRENVAVYREAEDLINIGAYKSGSSPKIDEAVRLKERLDSYLRQDAGERCDMEDSLQKLDEIWMDQ